MYTGNYTIKTDIIKIDDFKFLKCFLELERTATLSRRRQKWIQPLKQFLIIKLHARDRCAESVVMSLRASPYLFIGRCSVLFHFSFRTGPYLFIERCSRLLVLSILSRTSVIYWPVFSIVCSVIFCRVLFVHGVALRDLVSGRLL